MIWWTILQYEFKWDKHQFEMNTDWKIFIYMAWNYGTVQFVNNLCVYSCSERLLKDHICTLEEPSLSSLATAMHHALIQLFCKRNLLLVLRLPFRFYSQWIVCSSLKYSADLLKHQFNYIIFIDIYYEDLCIYQRYIVAIFLSVRILTLSLRE